jgi:acetylornithine deacetylase/succinyl-diaminopimelate desuccinylase-like protein
MVHAQLVERAKSLIDDLAKTPRFAGSAEETTARARCRRELEQAGFSCREMSFEYSQWLARWGVPLASFGIGALVYSMSLVGRAGNALASTVVIAGTFWAVWANAVSPQRGWVLTFPWSRSTAINLEAKRGNPSVWLVAHLDSKSQTVPMLLRVTGTVSLYIGALLVAFGALVPRSWGSAAEASLMAAQVLGILGAVTAGLCFVGNRSPGAADNASGVAAVLLAAQSPEAPESLGVLITSGEELGLAGAAAWAQKAPDQLVILNCDTVDEAGTYRCMYHDQPMRVAAAAESAAKEIGVPLKVGRMIPGIMSDSMVFANR